MAKHTLLNLLAASIASNGIARLDDAASLVQSRLASSSESGGSNISVLNSSGPSNNDTAPAIPPPPLLYRLMFTETFGATYACLTEIEFFDKDMKTLPINFVNQSSCYGCATVCENCYAPYGNPRAQFDGVVEPAEGVGVTMTSVEESLWSCTASGSYSGGKGSEALIFDIPQRPAKYSLRRAHVGDWVAKNWVLQEWKPRKGIWWSVSYVANASKTKDQTITVLDALNAKPFPEGFRSCDGLYANIVRRFTPNVDSTELNLDYSAFPGGHHRFVFNNGHGVQVDGNFGTLTLQDGIYDATQVNIRFPSEHMLPGTDEFAIGEVHILHQSRLVVGVPTRLAILTILLKLPQEGDPPTQDEMFFRGLGLDSIPDFGDYAPVPPVDLTMLDESITGAVSNVKCTDTLYWFVADTPAGVSGSIVQEFRRHFAVPLNVNSMALLHNENEEDYDDAEQSLDDVAPSSLPIQEQEPGGPPVPQPMTKTQMADAYATGEWGSMSAAQ